MVFRFDFRKTRGAVLFTEQALSLAFESDLLTYYQDMGGGNYRLIFPVNHLEEVTKYLLSSSIPFDFPPTLENQKYEVTAYVSEVR